MSYVNLKELFVRQWAILNQDKHNNKKIFIIYPLLIGVLCVFLFYRNIDSILEILAMFISIFVPLFINLLALLMSAVLNKITSRHNKERIELFKETFTNICYLIPISVFLIILLLLLKIDLFKECIIRDFNWNIPWCDCSYGFTISIYTIYYLIVGSVLFSGIAHLIMNIFMICKRIFKLFDKEIDLLCNKTNEKMEGVEEDDEKPTVY